MRKKAGDRATIAAIVKAQAMGGWKATVQEEAEAKVDELSRFGIEFTASDAGFFPDQPSDNLIVVHHYAEQGENEKENPAETDETPDPSHSETFASFVEDTDDQPQDTDAQPPSNKASSKKGFLKAFKRGKKKDKSSKDAKASKPKRSWGLMTPPRKAKQQPQAAPSPTSTSEQCSASAASDKAQHKDSPMREHNNNDAPQTVSKQPQESPQKQQEPVYTAYIRARSNRNPAEDVEVLRKEGDGGSFQFGTANHDGFEGHDVLATATEQAVVAFPTWELSGNDIPEEDSDVPDLDESHDDEDDYTSSSSMSPPSLKTMSSRLAKEREETERLRKLLEDKDEDLERLRELLRSNESAAVLERVNSLSQAVPQH